MVRMSLVEMARHGGPEGKYLEPRRQDFGVFLGIENRQKGGEAHQQETSWPRKDT